MLWEIFVVIGKLELFYSFMELMLLLWEYICFICWMLNVIGIAIVVIRIFFICYRKVSVFCGFIVSWKGWLYENGLVALWLHGFMRMVHGFVALCFLMLVLWEWSMVCEFMFHSVSVMRIYLLVLVHQSYINNLLAHFILLFYENCFKEK